jgi:predicted nucleic acid-binding protein
VAQVILVDADLLLYASIQAFPRHARAYRWFHEVLCVGAPVGIPWESTGAFLRLSTNARILEDPAIVADLRRENPLV